MKLVVWGANSYGQLGVGVRSELVSEPVYLNNSQLKNLPDLVHIKSICGGGGHTLLLYKDGSVYGCGSNSVGQLMVDDAVVLDFIKLPFLQKYNIVQLASKWDSCYAITAEGLCIGWGSNMYCQLGQPAEKFVSTREPVILAKDAVQVDCGARHCIILRSDGTVISVGDNKLGKLGRETPGVDANLENVQSLDHIKGIVCGFNHNIALSSSGEVYGWGCNKWGQLGRDPQSCRWSAEPIKLNTGMNTAISSIHAGWSSTHLLTFDGWIANFGRNNYGQLGQMKTCDVKDWELHILENISDVSVGSEHALGLTGERRLVAWGWNEHGSCGTGSVENVFSPVPVKINHSQKVLKFAAASGHNYALVEDEFLQMSKNNKSLD